MWTFQDISKINTSFYIYVILSTLLVMKTENQYKVLHVRNKVWGPGEMAQQLRALIALPEYQGSVPSTHMATQNCLKIQFQGIWYLHINAHKDK